jgi:hypothetical protein
MAYRVLTTFSAVPIGTRFRLAPNASTDWLKVSTRTARVNGNGAVFYFGQKENIRIDEGDADALEAKLRAKEVSK